MEKEGLMYCPLLVVLALVVARAPPLSSEAAGPAAAAAPAAAAPAGPAPAPCRPSEFTCHKSARCLPLNRFCDQRHDCDDSSDEPRGCSPCNRTYYGDLGRTYELELHRPREDRLPFVCRLTFTASGGDLGDLVQLTFESFTLGRFVSFTADGCPDGALHISESERPRGGGEWCGASWGPAVYVSETRSVSLLLRVLRLARSGQGAAATAASHGFDFRLAYKTLSRAAAVVRYGPPHPPPPLLTGAGHHNESSEESAPEQEPGFELGELMAGTSCSRLFSECSRRPCRLQSPNWPGVYPRNATCYYAVRQHAAPPGRHALIAVRQPRGQLVAIRSRSSHLLSRVGDGSGVAAPPAAAAQGPGLATGAASDRSQHDSRLKVWSECDEVQDYVTVYDGYTTRDPVLLRFCGGGQPVPEAVSSGPELLVQFSTAPYGTFLQQPPPPLPLHGFQLDVEVRYVPTQSWSYVRQKRCEWTVSGPPWRGWLESPRHSLPRGATCRWRVRAPPGRRVWLALLKFHADVAATGSTGQDTSDCDAASLALYDGELPPAPHALCLAVDRQCEQDKKDKVRFPAGGGGAASGNGIGIGTGTLLARFCRDVSPRSCEHALLRANASRPCSPAESFLSAGPVLTLQMHVREATALRPVEFVAQYELVDVREAGEPLPGPRRPCARQFSASPQDGVQELSTPPNVFLYGRGGAHNISCTYRLSASAGERVQVNVTSVRTGGRRCSGWASLWLLDVPWADAPPLRRRLLCPAAAPASFLSAAAALELRFRVAAMNATEDFSHIGFHATWQAVPAQPCPENRRLSGPSGEIRLRSPEKEYCDGQPWLIEPGAGRYLYVKIRGIALNETDGEGGVGGSSECATRNRVLLHTGGRGLGLALWGDGPLEVGGAGHRDPLVVCPSPARPDRRHRLVELFSEGWLPHADALLLDPAPPTAPPTSRGVVVELRAVEPGAYSLTWLELARRRSVHPPETLLQDECPWRCPELDACINASLWCDGVAHCPSGADERLAQCWPRLVPLPWAAAALAALLSLAALLCGAALARRRRRRRRNARSRLSSSSSGAGVAVRPAAHSKEVIC